MKSTIEDNDRAVKQKIEELGNHTAPAVQGLLERDAALAQVASGLGGDQDFLRRLVAFMRVKLRWTTLMICAMANARVWHSMCAAT